MLLGFYMKSCALNANWCQLLSLFAAFFSGARLFQWGSIELSWVSTMDFDFENDEVLGKVIAYFHHVHILGSKATRNECDNNQTVNEYICLLWTTSNLCPGDLRAELWRVHLPALPRPIQNETGLGSQAWFGLGWWIKGSPWKVLDQLIGWNAACQPSDKYVLTLVPQSSIPECWLPLYKFDYSKTTKAGCRGCQNNYCKTVWIDQCPFKSIKQFIGLHTTLLMFPDVSSTWTLQSSQPTRNSAYISRSSWLAIGPVQRAWRLHFPKPSHAEALQISQWE